MSELDKGLLPVPGRSRRVSLDFLRPSQPPKDSCCKSFAKFFVLFGMIGTWVAMSELLQNLQKGYSKPLFISWLIRALYTLLLLPWAAMYFRAKAAQPSLTLAQRYNFRPRRVAALFFLQSFIANFAAYTWYLSLPRTTVAANNSIYQSLPAMVYLLSIFWLKERVTLPKSVAVAVSVVGVVLISVAPQHTHDNDTKPSAAGYIWLMASVVSFAVFEVFNKAELEPEHGSAGRVGVATGASVGLMLEEPVEYRDRPTSVVSVEDGFMDDAPEHSLSVRLEKALLALGVIGVYSVAIMWVFIPILDAAGVEKFEMPPHDKWPLLMANAGMDLVYNALLMFGILLTTPLFMSIGTMLVLPTSIIVDKLVHDTNLAPIAIVGVVLVVVGFIILNVPSSEPRRRKAAFPVYS